MGSQRVLSSSQYVRMRSLLYSRIAVTPAPVRMAAFHNRSHDMPNHTLSSWRRCRNNSKAFTLISNVSRIYEYVDNPITNEYSYQKRMFHSSSMLPQAAFPATYKTRRSRQRTIPAKPSPNFEEENELGLTKHHVRDTYSVSDDDRKYLFVESSTRVPVRSMHISSNIDLLSVLSKVFGSEGSNPEHRFGKTSVIVKLPDFYTDDSVDMALSAVSPDVNRYVVLYRYGSVVFFNVPFSKQRDIIQQIKKYCEDPVAVGFEQQEKYDIVVQPGLTESELENVDVIKGDFATVSQLDMNNVAVISTIMSQTVALDSYNIIVETLLEAMETINTNIKKNGKISNDEREHLFKVVAQSNSLFNDMLTKLRVKERSDTAWNFVQYDRVYEGLKEEFELDERFSHVTFKLNLIQQNAKFFLDILHNQKSNTLEWIIIVLIGFECALMCLDMSGLGTMLMAPK